MAWYCFESQMRSLMWKCFENSKASGNMAVLFQNSKILASNVSIYLIKINISFFCVCWESVYVLLCWKDVCHFSFETGRRQTKRWWEIAGFSYPFKELRTGLNFIKEVQSNGQEEVADIGLQPVISHSCRVMGKPHRQLMWGSEMCLQCFQVVLIPNFFCQRYRISCVMAETTESPFVMLDCREHVF